MKNAIEVNYVNVILDICDSHPTCEGCIFLKEHRGCYFRGRSPKEWHEIREAQGRAEVNLNRIEVKFE